MHILLPWVAPALGIGALRIARRPGQRQLFAGLLACTLAYHAAALWSEFALFTGCAVKGDDKLYQFTAPAFCLGQFPLLTERLSITGWPWLAGSGLAGGFGCLTILLRQVWRHLKTTQTA